MITPIKYTYSDNINNLRQYFQTYAYDPYQPIDFLNTIQYQLPEQPQYLETSEEEIVEQPKQERTSGISKAIVVPVQEQPASQTTTQKPETKQSSTVTQSSTTKKENINVPTPDGKKVGTVSKSGRTSYILYKNYSPLPIDYVFNGKPLLSWDISDLMKARGITSVNGKGIKFGKSSRRTSSVGSPNSYHRSIDRATGKAMARDISIYGGTHRDYDALRKAVLNDPVVRSWMNYKGWGIINEITRAALNKTGGTGNHFHFGPDRWAQRTWAKWQLNPNINVATILQNGGRIINRFN